jgi:SAM-dependent methyltransferase
VSGAVLTRHYAKVCDLPDFAEAEVADLIPQIAPRLSADRPHRKGWEYARGALFLRDTGHLRRSSEILDVGAGSDEIVFWLSNRVRRVVAIDTYGRGPFRDREAVADMLSTPGKHAPYAFDRDRLEVRDMDARELAFPDGSFDAVVSFSSIEHVGGPRDIGRAAREIGRVLKPGGHALIVTELFVHQPLRARAPVQFAARLATGGRRCPDATPRRRAFPEVLKRSELHRWIVEASGLDLMQPLDCELSPESRASRYRFDERTVDEAPPHIVVEAVGSVFTSVALPLLKP